MHLHVVMIHSTKFHNNIASCLENSLDRRADGWTDRQGENYTSP